MNVVSAVVKRPLLYIGVSYTLFSLFVLDYFSTYQELYPTLVRLTNSSVFKLLVINTCVANFFLLWTVIRAVFFGRLNGPESEALQSTAVIYFVECVLSPLYLGESLMSVFTMYSVGLMILRVFHALAAERVTTLAITDDARRRRWNAGRLAVFLVCATLFDLYLWRSLWAEGSRVRAVIASHPNGNTESPEAALVMVYSGLLLIGQCVTSAVRCMVRLHRTLTHYGEDGHTALAFYANNIANVIESVAVVVAVTVVWAIAGPPFLLFRIALGRLMQCDESIRNLVRYVSLSHSVHRFADVEPDDLGREARCTICYDEMTAGPQCKRLPCGHCYHEHCLRGWFESNATCPYCRAKVGRPGPPRQPLAVHDPAPAPAVERVDSAEPFAGEEAVGGGLRAAGASPATDTPPLELRAWVNERYPNTKATFTHVDASRVSLFGAEDAPLTAAEDAEVRAAYIEYLQTLQEASGHFVRAAQRSSGSPQAAQATHGAPLSEASASVAPLNPVASPTATSADDEAQQPPSTAAPPRVARHRLILRISTPPRTRPTTPPTPPPPAQSSEPSPRAKTTLSRAAREAARIDAYRLYEEQIAKAHRTLQQSLAALDLDSEE